MNPYNIGFTIGTIIAVICTLIGVIAALWILYKICQFFVGKRAGKFLFGGVLFVFIKIVIFVMANGNLINNIAIR